MRPILLQGHVRLPIQVCLLGVALIRIGVGTSLDPNKVGIIKSWAVSIY